MNDSRLNLQDAMMSFAHLGGMMADTKQVNAALGRRPVSLTSFVSRQVKRQRA
jgi:hypothetical protein